MTRLKEALKVMVVVLLILAAALLAQHLDETGEAQPATLARTA